MDNLIAKIPLAAHSEILDIACGRGRHSIYLAAKGYRVTGIDLSERNIAFCKQFENSDLEFYVHDMRELFRTNCYDVALNLFTSFGYFDTDHDNLLALHTAAKAIKKGGYFILDFFNPATIRQATALKETKTVDGIQFNIEKTTEQNKVIKTIRFADEGKDFKFRESVQMIDYRQFVQYFNIVGLNIVHTFGNYSLHPFVEEESERLIFITQKQ